MFRYFIIFAVIFNLACQDRPYGERIFLQQQKIPRHFNGTVFMGSPIAGATIKAFQLSELKKGELLGQTTSNERGDYEISFESSYEGPILLEATGGHYRDLLSHEDSVLDSSKPLLSAIPHTNLISATNINAWTTIAIARVFATQGFWNSRIKDLEPKLRIEEDFAAISHFLSKEGLYVDIAKTPPMTEFNSLNRSGPFRLHLAHGGLAVLVKRANEEAKQKSTPITVLDLVQALSNDMENRKFDGKDSLDNRIRFSKLSEKYLSGYTLRNELASAISDFIHSDDVLNQHEIKTMVLEVQRSMLNEIAAYKGPELFSESDFVEPIEKKKPSLSIEFIGQHEKEIYFPVFKGQVKVSVKATDDSGISELELLEPPLGRIKNGERIELDQNLLPQASAALEACNDLDPTLIPKGLVGDKRPAICICVRAVDVFLNESLALQCFEREKLKFEAKSPAVDTIINVKELYQEVKLFGVASSGYPITECSWEIGWVKDKVLDPKFVLPAGQGRIDGTMCSIEHQLTQENMPLDGHFQLKVRIVDAAGQVFEEGYGRWQGHSFRIHAEPPEIEIISPKEGVSISKKTVKIIARQLSQGKMSSVWVELWKEGNWSSSRNFIASEKDNLWVAELDGLNSYENYTYKMYAHALNGSTYETTFRSLWIDDEPPQILGHADGIPQEAFTNERAEYTLRDSTILPAGSTQNIWSTKKSGPKIYRWINRLNDEKSAPSYQIKVKDNVGISEVRYAIALKCLPLEETTRNVKLAEGDALIKITPTNTNEDLTKLRDKELCLSIWAIDKAGNTANHTEIFSWSTLAPPVKVAFNEPAIKFADIYDFGNVETDLSGLISFTSKNAILSAGTVIGHIAIKNPHEYKLDIIMSEENSIDLKILLKRRLTLLDSSAWAYSRPLIGTPNLTGKHVLEENFWAFLNPFYSEAAEDIHPSSYGYFRNPTIYGKRCQRNELAIFIDDPRFIRTEGIASGVQNLECKPVLGFAEESYGNLFSQKNKEIDLDSEVKIVTIGSEFLEKEIVIFDRQHNEFLEEIPNTLGKLILSPNAEVVVKFKLKKDFPIPIPIENRAHDLCEKLEPMQQVQYKGSQFGTCSFALSSNDDKDEPYCRGGHCSSHLVFQTVEEVGFKIGKGYKPENVSPKIFLSETPKASFKYRVHVHEDEESANSINAGWDLPQNERRRSLSKK